MSNKVLITDEVHPVLIYRLEDSGYEVDYFTDYTTEKVAQNIHIYIGIIINSKINLQRTIIDKAVQLKFIGRLGSGMEIIDVPYANSKGIKCFNSPEGNRDAVAEHAIGMLLTLNNQLLSADRELRQFVWNRELHRGVELMGKTVGIIGYGNTGKALARKLAGFDTTILAYDKYKSGFDSENVEEVTLNELLAAADIVSLHIPLNDETRGWVNHNFINRCKDGVVFINTARGSIVVTKDLIAALKAKKVAGACLDVFENEQVGTYTSEEKKMYQELFAMNQVVLSPHIAGWTQESKFKLANMLADKILSNLTQR